MNEGKRVSKKRKAAVAASIENIANDAAMSAHSAVKEQIEARGGELAPMPEKLLESREIEKERRNKETIEGIKLLFSKPSHLVIKEGDEQALEPLTSDESADRLGIETGIKKGFMEIGSGLSKMRDRRLYRNTHTSFESYVIEQWGMSRPRAYQLMEAAEIVRNLSTLVDNPPTNERQARALSGLEPDKQHEVWKEATKVTSKPTPLEVEQAKRTVLVADEIEPLEPRWDKKRGEVSGVQVSSGPNESDGESKPATNVDDWLKKSKKRHEAEARRQEREDEADGEAFRAAPKITDEEYQRLFHETVERKWSQFLDGWPPKEQERVKQIINAICNR